MLNKTHIAVGAFFMLFFMHKVVHVGTYFIVFAIATLLPNMDRFISFKLFKGKGIITRKRGFFHSFTFCLIVTALLSWFFPVAAFPFFLAYGTHLIVDSWTVDGIIPFWPLRYSAKGSVRQGGKVEHMILYSFLAADAVMIWFRFLS